MPERRGTHARGVTRAFRFREFRVLWTAEVVSVAGDQLARVALAVAVFGRTGSKLEEGAIGLLSRGAMDRVELYEHATVLALLPFIDPELYGGAS